MSKSVPGSLRVLVMLGRASPALLATAIVFVLAEGALPNLVIVAMGHATGRIPAAVIHGLDSSAGRALASALALAGAIYALSLLRGPLESALGAAIRTRMAVDLQARLIAAVSSPAGVGPLEDPALQNHLAAATGELRGDRLADAPMTVLSQWGDRFSGVVACGVLATFRWWVGLALFATWLLVRRPSRAFIVQRVNTFGRATPALRHAVYQLNLVTGGPAAKEVRVFGLRDWLLDRHRAGWLEAMRPAWGELRRNRWTVTGLAVVVLGVYVLCAGALALAAYHRTVDLRILSTMLPMLPMSMQLGTISVGDVQLASMLASLPDVDALEDGLRAAESHGSLPVKSFDELRFEGVEFSYAGGDPVLCGIDLTLRAGESLALVGINGAGKTTLAALLARLYEPTAGTIRADGVPLDDMRADDWQRQVALVSQHVVKLPLSARENVTLDLLGRRSGDPRHAVTRAGAATVVERHGWDAPLDPRYPGGVDLSGGEWQRIALARALHAVERGAQILVLDEPTAHLDIRAEAAFNERFLELSAGITTIVIAHRFATVRRADRIAVLDGGVITELGTHHELVAAGGGYAQAFALQAEAFER